MKKIFLIGSLISFIAGCGPKPIPDPPATLKCEYRSAPLGIDAAKPRLSWEIPNSRRGTMQSAYQVIVSTSGSVFTETEADAWNSGMVKSARNIQVEYNGEPLKPGKRYFWKVKFWDENGTASEFSSSSWWETGLMDPSGWKGAWIYNGIPAPENEADMYKDTPVPLFRKEFNITKEVVSARLYITGLGYYESFLNGARVGDRMLEPGWTNYAKTIQYSVYDVTHMLQPGENAIGVIVGNGWYNPLPLYLFNRLNLRNILTIGQPKFIAQMNITYADGSSESVVSDVSWKTGNGPILMNNVYLGEKYDARLEQEGWAEPDFDEKTWSEVVIAEAPGGELVAQIQPPIRITRYVVPVKLTQPKRGTYIFDMGQNFAGVARLTVKGPAGTRVQMRYGELLHEDGTLDDRSTIACHIMEGWYVQHRPGAPRNANQTDTYILKGKGEEVYHSRFTFHGFRYVELTGFPGTPAFETLRGLRMNSDLAPAGKFECSNPLLTKIQENAEWTFLSNVFSIESDCPGREKFGYGGDIVTASEAYIYNYDMSNFYSKAVMDFSNDQRPSGGMPECAPDNAIYDKGLSEDTGPI
ncbi:MAG TPA: family 78 glycoside hydrolase catalytic domain, partial [Cyclobacteriaceae bacterium]|nr:family 78 glycoside hydrolase catalytic domain [Cyclobacteriaceae bacterium]